MKNRAPLQNDERKAPRENKSVILEVISKNKVTNFWNDPVLVGWFYYIATVFNHPTIV